MSLTKPADWDLWISFVRARATHSQIWNLIDPDVSPKPPSLTKPPLPQYTMPQNDADFDQRTFNAYKARLEMYKIDLLEFEKQTKALGDITAYIQETLTTNTASFIQSEDPHPWNYLRALKGRLAPSDRTRRIETEQRYHKLCRGPGNQQIDTWLDEWTMTYSKANKQGMFTSDEMRPIRDFLMAIRSKDTSYADARLVAIESQTTGDLYKQIDGFRQHLQRQQLYGR